ncbi:hypothetical protein V8G54_000283 [Vigna mungo]|uniref:Uncharacterized protein n=1 Tax=Vigna mungo TaxID=3915 RepID=A0AAQ3SAM5_VIGMU
MMRQDIQAILTILKDRKINSGGKRRDGSESLVNDNGGGTRGEGEPSGAGRTGTLINWRKRVELPMFEGGEPWNWIGQAEKFSRYRKWKKKRRCNWRLLAWKGTPEAGSNFGGRKPRTILGKG